MCGAYAATKVISISYGEAEYDLPAYYQKRECNEFMKLGLQGVSFLTSSGDSGSVQHHHPLNTPLILDIELRPALETLVRADAWDQSLIFSHLPFYQRTSDGAFFQ